MTRRAWLERAAGYLRQLEEREGPMAPAPEVSPTAAGLAGREPQMDEQAGSLFPDGALNGQPPWGGSPPRPELDPVGISDSLVCTVPEDAAERADLLARFHRETAACLKCTLGESRTNFVFGTGAPDADLMFIGEAPGAEEDARGEPFVGRAGKLLDRILEAIGFGREEVYIANILKCRPPDNRDPQALEVEACEPYLRRQIAIIRPAVLCALGRVAAQTLLKSTESLTRMRQKVHRYEGRPLVVTYHPAALLRNPNWKRPTWEDVQRLKDIHDREVGD